MSMLCMALLARKPRLRFFQKSCSITLYGKWHPNVMKKTQRMSVRGSINKIPDKKIWETGYFIAPLLCGPKKGILNGQKGVPWTLNDHFASLSDNMKSI